MGIGIGLAVAHGLVVAAGLLAALRAEDATWLVGAVTASFALGAAWVWRADRDAYGSGLMVLTAVAWAVGGVLHRGPLTHVLLAHPQSRPANGPERVGVALGYLDAVLETVVVLAAASVAWGAGLAAVAVLRLVQTPWPRRRALVVPAVAASVIGLMVGGGTIAIAAGWRPGELPARLYGSILLLVPVGLAWDRVRRPWADAAVTGLVVDLGAGGRGGTLRSRLAAALADPSLEIGFRTAGSAGYVDELGRPMPRRPPDASREVLRLQAGADEVLVVLDATIRSSPALLSSLAAAASIAAANVRVEAEVRHRANEVEASRRRIVEAADVQRLRLERQLRDGALARLARLRTRVLDLEDDLEPEWRPAAETVDASLRDVAEDLARLAAGLAPLGVEQEGLAEALERLARQGTIPASVEVEVGDIPAAVALTAWFVCSEALANVSKHALAARTWIVATEADGYLRLRVDDDGVGGAHREGAGLHGLRDRVESMGGRLTLGERPGGGTRVEAELPLDPADPVRQTPSPEPTGPPPAPTA